MKRYALLVLMLIAASALQGSAGADLKLPPVRTAALTNGIKLFYVQDELPQVTVVLSAGYGRMYEDRESAGMAELMAQAVSLGGSKRFPGTVLH